MLRLALKEVRAINWKEAGFDQEKAACLTLFAEAAYYKIKKDEYRKTARAKIVPCAGYQLAVVNGVRLRFEEALSGSDFDAFFVVQSRNFVALIVVVQDLTIIAVRGTYYLYDWKINFEVRKSPRVGERGGRFHAGFLREAELLGFHAYEHIAKLGRRTNVIVTGHSLGGAIAAVIASTGIRRPTFNGSNGYPVDQCYAFASPRYTSFHGMLCSGSPYNSINDFDIVPRVPPTMLGYSNFVYEFDLSGEPYADYETSAKSKTGAWLEALATGSFLNNHSMETYRRKLRIASRAH
jgi:Lipase (class 3)